MEVSDHVPHRTTYGQNNSWVVHEIPAEWLPVRWETKRPAGAIGRDCRASARNVCQEPSEVTKGAHIEHLEGRTETWSVSPSADMLPLGVTIPATVPQGSEIPEGLMNNPVCASLGAFTRQSVTSPNTRLHAVYLPWHTHLNGSKPLLLQRYVAFWSPSECINK